MAHPGKSMNQWESTVPVMKGGVASAERKRHLSRIIVPVNLQSDTKEVLNCAKVFAKGLPAIIEVLHVVHLNIVGEERGIPRANLVRGLRDQARQRLKTAVEDILDEELMAIIAIRQGVPDQAIVHEARIANATIIVMSCSRSGFGRWFRPDILRRVIRDAPCPVLVVRPGKGLQGSSVPKSNGMRNGAVVQDASWTWPFRPEEAS